MFIMFNGDLTMYKITLFSALMVMAYFEARFYIRSDNLKNKNAFYKISFIANSLVGLSLFIPVYQFDLIAIVLFVVRSFIVGKLYILSNHKVTKKQATKSFWILQPLNLLVLFIYNVVFFLVIMFGGMLIHFLLNL